MNGLALCAGIEGIGLGLSLAIPSYRTVCAVEIEAYAAAILVARQQESSLPPFPVWDDLYSFDGRTWRGVIHIVTAGWPCPPVSCAGQRRGRADERWLWPEVVRILRETEAPIFFGENVRGLLSAERGVAFETVLRDLAGLGLDALWQVVSAAQVGASHRRERVFILAYRHERGCQIMRKLSERRKEIADGGGEGVADSGDGLVPGPGRREEGRAWTGQAKQAMGKPADSGLPERTDIGRDGGEELAAALGAGLPDFPPGPDDDDAWRWVLERWPWLAPATGDGRDGDEAAQPSLRRVVDELSALVDRNRTDALRALGNACVPIQAACAFAMLARRLNREYAQMAQRRIENENPVFAKVATEERTK